jgi:hypothetical protein
VNYAEQRAKTLFFVWVSLTEHKWVILRERRGLEYGPGQMMPPIPGGSRRIRKLLGD